MEGSPASVRQLVAKLFADEAELRKRAADVARRITEHDAVPLWPHADALAGVLAGIDPAESRTRWHLGLVVARVAHTREQRMRAAGLMQLLAADDSNVVRCSAVEGLGLLAVPENSARAVAAEMVERALGSGSKAEMCRARKARQMLIRAGAWTGEDGT